MLVAAIEPSTIQPASPEAVGLDPGKLDRVCEIVAGHIGEGFHPGAQLAVARHGKLALYRSLGSATVPLSPVDERTLFPLFSNTKVITAAACWTLVEEGKLRFSDRVAEHVGGFGVHGKDGVTVAHLLTHQAGFPAAEVAPECFTDREQLRRAVCEFKLEWPPGSRSAYHRTAAHWVLAVLIEAITGADYRDEIRQRVIEPLGLALEMFLGLPEAEDHRAAAMYAPRQADQWPLDPAVSAPLFRRAGIPGAGGYATARAMAVFYQMMAQGGAWNGVRIVSPRMIDYVTRDFTGDLVDEYTGYAMHRGLGPFSRGQSGHPGLGSIGHPHTFGHSGVGTSYCWADPVSGVSFAFLSNCRRDNAWHNRRMDTLSTLVHASILR